MNKSVRKCSVVAIFHDDKVLVAVDQHQGYEILDLLGAVSLDGESAIRAAKRAVAEHLVGDYRLKPHGSVTSFINKPEGLVELVADAFVVHISSLHQIVRNPDRPTKWMTREELFNDPRNRRNNRLFDKFFDKEPIKLTIHEDQLGLWIDAKITEWREE